MNTYIVFVDWLTVRRFRYRIKTKRFEIDATDIISACDIAVAAVGNVINPTVSMVWWKV